MSDNLSSQIIEFSPKHCSLSTPAWIGHIPFASYIIKKIEPRVFVELGTHLGNSYFTFCQTIEESGLNTRCYAVDTWEGETHAGKYDESIFDFVSSYNEQNYSSFSNLQRKTFDKALEDFDNSSVDLLHIDGLHTYEAAKKDFETWEPKVCTGGIILFHDICCRNKDFGVWKLWEELKSQYPHTLSFNHSNGLGVLLKTKEAKVPHHLKDLFAPDKSHQWQAIFATAGENLQHRLLQHYEEALKSSRQEQSKTQEALAKSRQKFTTLNAKTTEAVRIIKLHNIPLHKKTANTIASIFKSSQNVHLKKNVYLKIKWGSGRKRNGTFKITGSCYNLSSQRINLQIKLGKRTIPPSIFRTSTCEQPSNAINVDELVEFQFDFKCGTGIKLIQLQVVNENKSVNASSRLYWVEQLPKRKKDDTAYDKWIQEIEPKTWGQNPDNGPLISIIMPVYNTPQKWLIKAISSVLNQKYENWELCIANDASTDKHIRTTLDQFAASDSRIHVTHRKQNGHISEASNSALSMVKGSYVGLLDHDDQLHANALAEVADTLSQKPNTKIVYSDEDKIDEQGKRFSPYFKPDWNPDLLCSQNYFCHFCVYEKALLDEVGGFRVGYEGAQDWDLAIRCSEQVDADQIVHIPKILYHWRAIEGSTAQCLTHKSYHTAAGKKLLEGHLERLNLCGSVTEVPGGHWRIQYEVGDEEPMVSIIIPTRNGSHILEPCIESIFSKTTYSNYEIIIIDNGSDEEDTLEFLSKVSKDKRVRIIKDDRAFNYSALNNSAVQSAKGEFVLLLNNDIEPITPNWIEEMLSHALRPGIGAVGAMLYYPNDTVQHAGVVLGIAGPQLINGVAGHAFKGFKKGDSGYMNRMRLVQNYSAVTAACLLIRKSIYDEIGGLDEHNLSVSFNDVDFCLRVLKAGYRNIWTPFAELYHHESASRGAEDTPEKKARATSEAKYMRDQWSSILDNDPAYNPNLTKIHEDFSFME